MAIVLITGPVRSGKSTFAQRLASERGAPVTYVATAAREHGDDEWNARIERHRLDRPATWTTVESAALAPQTLYDLFAGAGADRTIVVDALGTWLAAQMPADPEALEEEAHRFAEAMAASAAHVIVVGEQVGWDVVPVEPAARLFRDVLGRMLQRIGERAAAAYLVVAGFAIDLRAGVRVR